MTRPQLSTRQAQIVERIAKGLPDKVIAADLGISIDTVRNHIKAAAARIPGNAAPRYRFTVFAHQHGLVFFGASEDQGY